MKHLLKSMIHYEPSPVRVAEESVPTMREGHAPRLLIKRMRTVGSRR